MPDLSSYVHSMSINPIDGKPMPNVGTGSLSDLKSLGINVTSATVAVELTTGLLPGKIQLVIYPPTAGKIYWGSTSVSLATNGLPLSAGDAPVVFNFAVAGGFPVYAVNDGTTRNVRVGESR